MLQCFFIRVFSDSVNWKFSVCDFRENDREKGLCRTFWKLSLTMTLTQVMDRNQKKKEEGKKKKISFVH